MKVRYQFHRAIIVALLIVFGFCTARGDVLHGIGAVGDGGAGAFVGNPPVINPASPMVMLQNRGLNFGGPGLPYDVAAVGASSSSVLNANGQVAQLVAQAQSGNVTLVLYSIGYNDILGVRNQIASGSLAGAALQQAQDFLENNIENGVNQLLAAGANVVIGGFNDMVYDPVFAPINADPVQKARFEGALAISEARLEAFAASKALPFVDFFALQKALFESGSFVVGGVNINLTTVGPDPHNFFQDSLNAGLVIRAEVANLYIQAMNEGFHTNLPLMTDQEILALAGLGGEYQGLNMFSTAENLTKYTSFVPEPGGATLLAVGLGVLVGCGVVRRRTGSRAA